MQESQAGINRNIVECKGNWSVNPLQSQHVLIETLWNVKSAKTEPISPTNPVLIETLWNVKRETPAAGLTGRWCINRNIVECKGAKKYCILVANN